MDIWNYALSVLILSASSVQAAGSCASISCEGAGIVGICLESETRICEFSVELDGDQCVSFEINIGDYPNATLRIIANGDFEECFCNPACGKLEMSVAGGKVQWTVKVRSPAGTVVYILRVS